MSKKTQFFAFLESLKSESNQSLIESVKVGYELMEGEMSDLEDQVNFGEEPYPIESDESELQKVANDTYPGVPNASATKNIVLAPMDSTKELNGLLQSGWKVWAVNLTGRGNTQYTLYRE